MTGSRRGGRVLAAALLLAAAAPARAAGVQEWLLRFASAPTRYLGSPGQRATVAAVEALFRSVGMEGVHRETFTVVAPVEQDVTIQGPGLPRTVLHAVWPNHVQCTTTPRDGLTGPLLDGGHGEAAALNGHDVRGSLVLVRVPLAEGPQSWTTPFLLGAAAVIFVPPAAGELFTRAEAEELFLNVAADLPRVWAPPAAVPALLAAARRGARATLRARMGWAPIQAENVVGVFPGSPVRFPSADKASTATWADKRVVLQAYTDAMSVVPALAPGAEEAGGLAALMELAKTFSAKRPPCTVTFLATSGHDHALSGTHEWLARHLRHRPEFTRSITAGEAVKADLFIGLDLTSGDERVAAFSQGTFYSGWDGNQLAQNAFAGTARLLDEHAKVLWGPDAPGRYLNGVSPPTRAWKDLLGLKVAFDAEAATTMGTPGLTLATPFDARQSQDTPEDVPARVNAGALGRQVETLTALLAAAFADPRFFPENRLELPDYLRAVNGEIHEFERTITGLPNKPIAGALLVIKAGGNLSQARQRTLGPVRPLQATLSRAYDPALTVSVTGRFRFPTVRITEYWNWVTMDLEGYVFDEDGRITLSPDQGPLAGDQYSANVSIGPDAEKSSILVLFRGRPLTLLEPVDARHLVYVDKLTLTDGLDQPFMNYGTQVVANQSGAIEGFTPAAVVFAPVVPGVDPRVKLLFQSGPFGLQSIFTGADEGLLDRADVTMAQAQGTGYDARERVLARAPFEGAKDLWLLDDARGRNLRKYHVRSFRIESLHDKARAALDEARAAWKAMRYDAFLESARAAWGYEARAYPEFKSVANDLVQTVVFYCLLLMPFAFCMERLMFAFADLRRQLLATAAIFCLGFGALSQVHPAFKISSNPVIIFLAFIILSLGLIVLAIVMAKFQRELRRMKGERGDYEAVDIGRVSATVAALVLGLSNLRRRPTRTALTVTTVVVLTFTVLSLVSLSSTISFFRLPRGTTPPYAGALIRDVSWQVLQPPVARFVAGALGKDAAVLPRAWVTARKRDEALLLEVSADGGRRANATALLGLTPGEAAILKPAAKLGLKGRWLKATDRAACLVPESLAARLGVGVGGRVTVRGMPLAVVGTFRGAGLDAAKDLDGESVSPAKFTVHRAQYNYEASDEPTATTHPTESFNASEHQPGDTVVIVPFALAMSLEGKMRAIAVVPNPGKGAEGFAAGLKDFLVRAAVIALVSDGAKVQVMTSIGAVSVNGFWDLLLPILLVSLIVLNTMMGSVHERVREISIFSSVGLAPVHIGALFVAEAFVVAIVGVVTGYLLAQAIAAVLLGTGSLAGLSLNYSSSAAVGACLIVIAAVMLSTIYPARRASELSVPDVTRRWTLPPAKGDRLEFDFPFTVGEPDLIGLFTYLADLFHAYRDSSIGSFAADHVTERRTAQGVRIDMDCWLTPYDLGISQRVTFEAFPMDVPGLFRVQVTLVRTSGEAGAWHRQNRRFLSALRKRFLIWRMFGPARKVEYRDRGVARMEAARA